MQLLRRSLLFGLFAFILLSNLASYFLAYQYGILEMGMLWGILMLAAMISLLIWSIVYLKKEPLLTRIALSVEILLIVAFVAFCLIANGSPPRGVF